MSGQVGLKHPRIRKECISFASVMFFSRFSGINRLAQACTPWRYVTDISRQLCEMPVCNSNLKSDPFSISGNRG